MYKLSYEDGSEFLPTENLTAPGAIRTASTTTSHDIYGNPISVVYEQRSSSEMFVMKYDYISLELLQKALEAYNKTTTLIYEDHNEQLYSVLISSYPSIERHKALDTVVYSVVLTLSANSSSNFEAPITNWNAPRLFGR